MHRNARRRASLDLHLKDSTLEKYSKSGIVARTNFEVSPGTYRVREVATESEEHHMAALSRNAGIPTQNVIVDPR